MAAFRTAAVCMAASMATVALAIRMRTRRLSLRKKETVQRNQKCCDTQQQASQLNDNQLADKFVVVVGLGGVGSHAAHMLVRGDNSPDMLGFKISNSLTSHYNVCYISCTAGVRKLRIIDFDLVSLSTLNRHCCASHAHGGILLFVCSS